jgi:hypothetical protein
MKIAALLAIFVILGCASGGTPSPEPQTNLYQPANTPSTCSEIEYKWFVSGEEKHSFYPNEGSFCTHLPGLVGTPKMRCVTRGPSGEVITSSPWVAGVPTTDVAEFRRLCPID